MLSTVETAKVALKKIPLNLHTVLGIFAALGFLGMIHLVFLTSRNVPAGIPITQPPASVFQNFIAGEGIIEASSNNINIGCLVSGIVKDVVDVGTKVKVGDPLFTLDQSQAKADLALKQSQVDQSKAALKQAEAVMTSSKTKYEIAKKITDKRAISRDDYLSRENQYSIDQAGYVTAQEALKVAEAQFQTSKVNLDALTIRAPIDADVLQVNISPGEYALNQQKNPSLLLLGKVGQLQVRIDIDENEAWRYQKGARGIAYIRGNTKIKFDLAFDRIEPYVLPKTSLTGDSSERVDVRVFQVIYKFNNDKPNVYVGQQVDVFIEVSDTAPFISQLVK
ncbi:MAG: secretion protein HlyD [Alphaproteobacteria bacterium]|nr:secretion protein HlyD [Alphaproteobacteria bacterium]